MKLRAPLFLLLASLPFTAAADTAGDIVTAPDFVITGSLENRKLDEASGLQAGPGGVFFVHNDEKRDVFVIDAGGRHLGSFKLDKAKNKDWEDVARIPDHDPPLLVIADTGDNKAVRRSARLFFSPSPLPARTIGTAMRSTGSRCATPAGHAMWSRCHTIHRAALCCC